MCEENKSVLSDKKGLLIGEYGVCQYKIFSDTCCIGVEEYCILNKVKVVKDENGKPLLDENKKQIRETYEEYGLKNTTYHRTLKQALSHCLENELLKCDFTNIQNIMDKLNWFEEQFNKFEEFNKKALDIALDLIE